MASQQPGLESSGVIELEGALEKLHKTPPFDDARAERARSELAISIAGILADIGAYPDDPQPGQLTNIRQHLLDASLMSEPEAVAESLAFTDGTTVQRYRKAIQALTGASPRDVLVAPLGQPLPETQNDGSSHGTNFGWICRQALLRAHVAEPNGEHFSHPLLHELFHSGEGRDENAEDYSRWLPEIAVLEGAIETLCHAMGPLTEYAGAYYVEIGVTRILARERGLTAVELAKQIWQSPRPLLTLATHHREVQGETALNQIAAQIDALQQRLRPLAEDKSLGDFLAEVDRIPPRLGDLNVAEASLDGADSVAIELHI